MELILPGFIIGGGEVPEDGRSLGPRPGQALYHLATLAPARLAAGPPGRPPLPLLTFMLTQSLSEFA